MRATWPQASAADAGLLSEVLVRLAISTATLPAAHGGLTGRSLAQVLGPFADQALGATAPGTGAARG